MVSANEPKFYILIFYMISNEMMSNFYMLSSRMMNWVLTKVDGTSVITMNRDPIQVRYVIMQLMFDLENL